MKVQWGKYSLVTQTLKSSHWGHVGRNIEVIWQSRIGRGEWSVTEQTAIHNTHTNHLLENTMCSSECVWLLLNFWAAQKCYSFFFYIQDQCVLGRKVVMLWLTPRGQGTWEKETTVSPTENFVLLFFSYFALWLFPRFFHSYYKGLGKLMESKTNISHLFS